jgi:hypothetical protein
MNRRQAYIEAFNNANIPKKIRVIKAIEAYGRLDKDYRGISSKIDNIAEVLESIYPERWDVLLVKRELRVKNRRGNYTTTYAAEFPFTLEFIIHFPLINITNTEQEKHVIRDLYIKLTPCQAGNGSGLTFENIQGRRMTANKEEIYSKYQHSHLPSRDYKVYPINDIDHGAFRWRGFCLGESEIRQVFTMLSSKYNEGTFRLLLLQLEEYVNWESIEGTPHIHMRNVVGNFKLDSLDTHSIVNYANAIGEREVKKEVDFILEGNQVKILQNEKFEEYLRLYDSHNHYSTDVIARVDSKGRYYQYRFFSADISSIHLSSEEELKGIGFMFREQRVDFKIVEDVNQEVDRKFYIHKQIKEYVKNTIEERIKSARFRSHITESLNTIENISENTRQNRLFVPINQ